MSKYGSVRFPNRYVRLPFADKRLEPVATPSGTGLASECDSDSGQDSTLTATVVT
jgi:hypothetical protein